jgi:hypothetical protein
MSPAPLVVRRHSPWRNVAGGVVLGALVLAGGYLAYRGGYLWGETALEAVRKERDQLRAEVAALQLGTADLQGRIAFLERAGQVERQAYRQVEANLRQLEGTIGELREELGFYQGISGGGSAGRGLEVQSLRLLAREQSGRFGYKLVLTREMKSDKFAQGTVALVVSGQQDGSPRQLGLAELAADGASELRFRLLHFQRLEGEIVLPEGFLPQSVLVRVSTSGGAQARIEKTYDWTGLLG